MQKKNQTSEIPESIYIWIKTQEGIEGGGTYLETEKSSQKKSPCSNLLSYHSALTNSDFLWVMKLYFHRTVLSESAFQMQTLFNHEHTRDLLMENRRGGQILGDWRNKRSWTALCACWEPNWGPLWYEEQYALLTSECWLSSPHYLKVISPAIWIMFPWSLVNLKRSIKHSAIIVDLLSTWNNTFPFLINAGHFLTFNCLFYYFNIEVPTDLKKNN